MPRMTADEIASMTHEQVADAAEKVLRWVEQNEATIPYAREAHALVTRAVTLARAAVRGKLINAVQAVGREGWQLDDAHTPACYRHPKHPDPVSIAVFDEAFRAPAAEHAPKGKTAEKTGS